MNPPIGLVTPVKAATGQWLLEFFAQFHADTPQSVEWAARAPEKAMVWAPARMVDSVEEMLTTWRRNDNSVESALIGMMSVWIKSSRT